MRISATTLESFRLFMEPEQDWMPESDLIESITGIWRPNRKVLYGQAFGSILEHPERYRVSGGYRVTPRGSVEAFDLGDDIMAPMLALIDRPATVFEAKAVKRYGPHDVVSKADQLVGSRLIETKSTQSYDFDKYANSCQWRFMADAFEPSLVTYHVCCLYENAAGRMEPRGIESFNLYPYAELHQDCAVLVDEFVSYVKARGLDGYLQARQDAAA